MGMHAAVADHVRKPARSGRSMIASSRACSRCASFRPRGAIVTGAVRAGVKGLVLEGVRNGSAQQIGRSLIPAIEHARAANVP